MIVYTVGLQLQLLCVVSAYQGLMSGHQNEVSAQQTGVSAYQSVVSGQQHVGIAKNVVVSASVSPEYNPVLTVSGCGHVRLVCEAGQMMVVREASFTPLVGEEECQGGPVGDNNQDILLAVVRRCNGDREAECVFDMGVDLPESGSWGRGRTSVRYSCQESIHSYCGGRVDVVGEGYISSPGYPRYYLGGRECVWTMMAKEGQKIKLEVADLSLRETGEECHDSVLIKEDGVTMVRQGFTKN